MSDDVPRDARVSHDSYVTHDSWLQPTGRPDAIDEIADQFERPVEVEAPALAVFPAVVDGAGRWPTRSSGWRSVGRLHTDLPERRVS